MNGLTPDNVSIRKSMDGQSGANAGKGQLQELGNKVETPRSTGPVRKRRRPPYSYTALIAQAILMSEEKQLTLREIYDSINETYPQICKGPDIGWQNTIRHNLSLNQCFKRIPRHKLPPNLSSKLRGKGSYWTVDVELMDQNTRRRLEEALSKAAAIGQCISILPRPSCCPSNSSRSSPATDRVSRFGSSPIFHVESPKSNFALQMPALGHGRVPAYEGSSPIMLSTCNGVASSGKVYIENTSTPSPLLPSLTSQVASCDNSRIDSRRYRVQNEYEAPLSPYCLSDERARSMDTKSNEMSRGGFGAAVVLPPPYRYPKILSGARTHLRRISRDFRNEASAIPIPQGSSIVDYSRESPSQWGLGSGISASQPPSTAETRHTHQAALSMRYNAFEVEVSYSRSTAKQQQQHRHYQQQKQQQKQQFPKQHCGMQNNSTRPSAYPTTKSTPYKEREVSSETIEHGYRESPSTLSPASSYLPYSDNGSISAPGAASKSASSVGESIDKPLQSVEKLSINHILN